MNSVIVDTSVWITFLKKGDADLQKLLELDHAVMHPFVTGELICGNIPHRQVFLSSIKKLTEIEVVRAEDLRIFIDHHRLYGVGLSFVDLSILASAFVSHAKVFTRDKLLMHYAQRLSIHFSGG